MKVKIVELPEKYLICKSARMSLVKNTTPQLWRSFMTEKKMIENPVGTNLYSIQTYDDATYFENFNPETVFTKYAAIEVNTFENTPKGFSSFTLNSGRYAVFLHQGLSSSFTKTMQYIFNDWLPKSDYQIASRPHFELLGKKYKTNSSESTEEVWIPIEEKS